LRARGDSREEENEDANWTTEHHNNIFETLSIFIGLSIISAVYKSMGDSAAYMAGFVVLFLESICKGRVALIIYLLRNWDWVGAAQFFRFIRHQSISSPAYQTGVVPSAS
jgi:hypothetical protein